MEQNTFEILDIKKAKELFEYEMTDVILKLKGEFSVISGEKTRYHEAAVDGRKLKADPVALPAVKYRHHRIYTPATAICTVCEMKVVECGSLCPQNIPVIPSVNKGVPDFHLDLVDLRPKVPGQMIAKTEALKIVQWKKGMAVDLRSAARTHALSVKWKKASVFSAIPDMKRLRSLKPLTNAQAVSISAWSAPAPRPLHVYINAVSKERLLSMKRIVLPEAGIRIPACDIRKADCRANAAADITMPAVKHSQLRLSTVPQVRVITPVISVPNTMPELKTHSVGHVTPKTTEAHHGSIRQFILPKLKNQFIGHVTLNMTRAHKDVFHQVSQISVPSAFSVSIIHATVNAPKFLPGSPGKICICVEMNGNRKARIPDVRVPTAQVGTYKKQKSAPMPRFNLKVCLKTSTPEITVKQIKTAIPTKLAIADIIQAAGKAE